MKKRWACLSMKNSRKEARRFRIEDLYIEKRRTNKGLSHPSAKNRRVPFNATHLIQWICIAPPDPSWTLLIVSQSDRSSVKTSLSKSCHGGSSRSEKACEFEGDTIKPSPILEPGCRSIVRKAFDEQYHGVPSVFPGPISSSAPCSQTFSQKNTLTPA